MIKSIHSKQLLFIVLLLVFVFAYFVDNLFLL